MANTLDTSTFAKLAEPHRRALRVHCYRMLGSFDESEDVVQEAFLRAWRQRASFEGRSPFRTWLYRIATNACLDALRHTARRMLPHQVVPANTSPEQVSVPSNVRWLQPYPDRLLDEVAAPDSGPDEMVIAKETIELTFIAAIQLLPPRQRAVLVVRDVLGWSAAETSSVLDTSVASVNSMLQRARATIQRNRPADRLEWARAQDSSEHERELLQRFMSGCERADAASIVDLLSEDVRCTMPPYAWWFDGIEAVTASLHEGLSVAVSPGDFRLLPTRANRQPATGTYVRRWGELEYRPFAVHVLGIQGDRIVEITVFHEPALFTAFNLPATA